MWRVQCAHLFQGGDKTMSFPLSLRARVAAGLSCLLVAGTLPAAESYVYRETRGAETNLYVWTLDAVDNDVRVTFAQDPQTHVTLCQPNGAAFRWSFRDDNTEVQAHRVGQEVIITGQRGGQPFNKRIDVGDEPWYQPLSYSLRQFVHSDSSTARFWLMRPDTFDTLRLKAERAGRERIATQTGDVLADKVRISTTGLLSGMWAAYYWFDADTGVFLRYEGVNGLPGTPKTVIQLLKSEQHATAGP